ncbi:hypothetical protein C2W62_08850 [Candidatus Entotheonella serta]|nr:hypothetical protein C2W62_08850 [Candidatus Entotheonella serta]
MLRQHIVTLYPRSAPPPQVLAPWYNPPTPAKIALGRLLFFDPHLSRCGTVACASCHQPQNDYASPEPIPRGCQGRMGRRRAPSLYNVAYRRHLFWDGREQSLEQQALTPIVSPTEMNNMWTAVLTYLKSGRHEFTGTTHPERWAQYGERFADVFSGEITPVTVAQALAAYERTLIAREASFDHWLAGDDTALIPLQKRGWHSFLAVPIVPFVIHRRCSRTMAFTTLPCPKPVLRNPSIFPTMPASASMRRRGAGLSP